MSNRTSAALSSADIASPPPVQPRPGIDPRQVGAHFANRQREEVATRNAEDRQLATTYRRQAAEQVSAANAQAREMEHQQKADALETARALETQRRADFATRGVKTFVAPGGKATPILDAKGKETFDTQTGPIQMNEKGEPFRVKRDATGKETIEYPDADAKFITNEDDPTDPKIYRDRKFAPPVAIDPEEGIHSEDQRTRAASANRLKTLEARRMKSELDRLDIEESEASAARSRPEKSEVTKAREGIADPEAPAELKTQYQGVLDAEDAYVKRARRKAELGLAMNKLASVRTEDYIANRLAQKPEEPQAALEAFGARLKTEGEALSRDVQAFNDKWKAGHTDADTGFQGERLALQERQQRFQSEAAEHNSRAQELKKHADLAAVLHLWEKYSKPDQSAAATAPKADDVKALDPEGVHVSATGIEIPNAQPLFGVGRRWGLLADSLKDAGAMLKHPNSTRSMIYIPGAGKRQVTIDERKTGAEFAGTILQDIKTMRDEQTAASDAWDAKEGEFYANSQAPAELAQGEKAKAMQKVFDEQKTRRRELGKRLTQLRNEVVQGRAPVESLVEAAQAMGGDPRIAPDVNEVMDAAGDRMAQDVFVQQKRMDALEKYASEYAGTPLFDLDGSVQEAYQRQQQQLLREQKNMETVKDNAKYPHLYGIGWGDAKNIGESLKGWGAGSYNSWLAMRAAANYYTGDSEEGEALHKAVMEFDQYASKVDQYSGAWEIPDAYRDTLRTGRDWRQFIAKSTVEAAPSIAVGLVTGGAGAMMGRFVGGARAFMGIGIRGAATELTGAVAGKSMQAAVNFVKAGLVNEARAGAPGLFTQAVRQAAQKSGQKLGMYAGNFAGSYMQNAGEYVANAVARISPDEWKNDPAKVNRAIGGALVAGIPAAALDMLDGNENKMLQAMLGDAPRNVAKKFSKAAGRFLWDVGTSTLKEAGTGFGQGVLGILSNRYADGKDLSTPFTAAEVDEVMQSTLAEAAGGGVMGATTKGLSSARTAYKTWQTGKAVHVAQSMVDTERATLDGLLVPQSAALADQEALVEELRGQYDAATASGTGEQALEARRALLEAVQGMGEKIKAHREANGAVEAELAKAEAGAAALTAPESAAAVQENVERARATIRLANGADPATLTDAEVAALGFGRGTGGKLTPSQTAPAGQWASEGADGKLIPSDRAIAAARQVAPSASPLLRRTEQQMRETAVRASETPTTPTASETPTTPTDEQGQATPQPEASGGTGIAAMEGGAVEPVLPEQRDMRLVPGEPDAQQPKAGGKGKGKPAEPQFVVETADGQEQVVSAPDAKQARKKVTRTGKKVKAVIPAESSQNVPEAGKIAGSIAETEPQAAPAEEAPASPAVEPRAQTVPEYLNGLERRTLAENPQMSKDDKATLTRALLVFGPFVHAFRAAFPGGVIITPNKVGSAGLVYTTEPTGTLAISLPDFTKHLKHAKDVRKWALAAVLEEVVHAIVDTHKLLKSGGAIMAQIAESAPATHKLIREAYPTANTPEGTVTQIHEFIRMVVQGRIKMTLAGVTIDGELTEDQYSESVLGLFLKVLREFRAFVKNMVKAVGPKLAADIEAQAAIVEGHIQALLDGKVGGRDEGTPNPGNPGMGGPKQSLATPESRRAKGQEVLAALAKISGSQLSQVAAESVVDGTFNGDFRGAGTATLDIDEEGNVVLRRFATDASHMTKHGQTSAGVGDLWATSETHGGGNGVPTIGTARGVSGVPQGSYAGYAKEGVFKIPADEFLKLAKAGEVVLGNIGETEVVISPAVAEKYLVEMTDRASGAKEVSSSKPKAGAVPDAEPAPTPAPGSEAKPEQYLTKPHPTNSELVEIRSISGQRYFAKQSELDDPAIKMPRLYRMDGQKSEEGRINRANIIKADLSKYEGETEFPDVPALLRAGYSLPATQPKDTPDHKQHVEAWNRGLRPYTYDGKNIVEEWVEAPGSPIGARLTGVGIWAKPGKDSPAATPYSPAKAPTTSELPKPTESVEPPTIDAPANEAATSPENDIPQPTEAQKKAGNYQKGHVRFGGMDISIENAAGSERTGVDASGKKWSVTMKSHYGYVRGTEGKDGDHVDIFIAEGTPLDYDGPVFVVNQVKANGHFDEHKAVTGIGITNDAAAKNEYRSNYNRGWWGLPGDGGLKSKYADVVEFANMAAFREWLATADLTKPAEIESAAPGDQPEGGADAVLAKPGAGSSTPVVSALPESDTIPQDVKPSLTPEEQAVKDILDGILGRQIKSQPVGERAFDTSIPDAAFLPLMQAARALYKSGVNAPDALAASLTRMGAAYTQFTNQIWTAIRVTDSSLEPSPDWSAVYSALEKPASITEPAADERQLEQRTTSIETGDTAPVGENPEPAGDEDSGRMGGDGQEADAGVGSGGSAGEKVAGSGRKGRGNRGGSASTRNTSPDGQGDTGGTRDSDAPDTGGIASSNYLITAADNLGAGSLRQKYADNVAAIKLVKTLQDEGRGATQAEKRVLVKYVGWGGIKGVFNPANKEWGAAHRELKVLLTEEEYAAASRSQLDAHYTSEEIITRGVWAAMQRFGFTGGKMYEGGVGVGHFIGLMPDAIRPASHYIGVEQDAISAAVAQYLYPEAKIWHMGFQDAALSPGSADGIVGNPPFGQQSLYDPQFKHLGKFSIHNYFIAKQLELLRPGGVAAFVVSRYFLDALDSTAREHIAKSAEFLGAIRLPNTAFKGNANTEVVTDIVFFKKLPHGKSGATTWTKAAKRKDEATGAEFSLNRWINDSPQMVLGTPAMTGSQYRENEYTVEPVPGAGLGELLDEAVGKLPQGVYEHVDAATAERLTTPEIVEGAGTPRVGGYMVGKDGEIYRRLPDVDMAARYESAGIAADTSRKKMRGMIAIRDAMNRLVSSEIKDESAEKMDGLRKRLNAAYDAFVKEFGPLNKQGNRQAFSRDPEASRILGLEREFDAGVSKDAAKKKGIDPRNPSAKKADIFQKRTNVPYIEITHAETAKEALAASLNQRGMVSLPYMQELTGMDEERILSDLEGVVFRLPEGGFDMRDLYLSGNVRAKLNAAKEAAEESPEFQKNVDALEKAQPAPLMPEQISATIGAGWIPENVYADFVQSLVGERPQSLVYLKATGGWAFRLDSNSLAANQTWGVPKTASSNEEDGSPGKSFGALFSDLLNAKPPTVYITVDKKRLVHQSATSAAIEKTEAIKAKWQEWLFQDKERRDRLTQIYNEKVNNYADAKFDGSHLQFPGMSALVELRRHQSDVAWRIITQGSTLLDHVVGAGKTFAGIAAFAEMRRTGRVRKPLFAVPNHLVTQWRDDFIKLYPNANVLYAKPSDFAKDKRKVLFAKIMTGEYDAIIVGHSSLGKIAMDPEGQRELLSEMVEEIMDTIRALKGDATNGRAIATLERQKESLEQKMKKLADRQRGDDTVTFEELGIDALFVDEAHEFKNLFYTTQMQRVAGLGNPTGSGKAFDLYLKTRQLRKRFGAKAPVVFATGTPLSNSLVEMFTIQRYLQPEALQDMGATTLDAWAKMFGDVKQVYEVNPTGTGYRMATRFAEFQNVGDLSSAYKTVADVIAQPDLERQAQESGETFPIPKVAGGKPKVFAVKRSEEQEKYFGVETQVTDAEGNGVFDSEGNPVTAYPQGSINWRVDNMPDDPREDNMLKLTSDARKAGLDMRLINPKLPDDPNSKVNVAVKEMEREYRKWDADKGTQLVFCDLSVPSSSRGKAKAKAAAQEASDESAVEEIDDEQEDATEEISMDELLAESSTFSVYDDVRDKLIAAGIPANEIAFIHDYDTPEKKAKLFADMNAGRVRILMGSTPKLGAGTNVQERLVALHHLDAPWRPSDLEQREGRIIRQGNLLYKRDPEGFEVFIGRYGTELTYDARMWQIIEHKAAGIEGFKRADRSTRTMQDIAGEAANAADMKAATSGNPLIREEIELRGKLEKLLQLQKAWQANQYTLDRDISYYEREPKRVENNRKDVTAKIAARDKYKGEEFEMVLSPPRGSKKRFDEKSGIAEVIAESVRHMKDTRNKSWPGIGEYRGFSLGLEIEADRLAITMAAPGVPRWVVTRYSKDDALSDVGFVQRLDNALKALDDDLVAQDYRIPQAEKKIKDLTEAKSAPFTKAAEIEETRKKHVEIRAALMESKKSAPVKRAGGSGGSQVSPGPLTPADPALLTDEVMRTLRRADITGSFLKLPEQLDSKLYKKVNAALESAGGRWDKASKTHVFAGDPTGALGLQQGQRIYSRAIPAPAFYSQLERLIESKMPNRAPGHQVGAIVSNPQNGVKAEELKWSGLLPWLAVQPGPVTKDAVLEFLRGVGAVRFEEVGPGIDVYETLYGPSTLRWRPDARHGKVREEVVGSVVKEIADRKRLFVDGLRFISRKPINTAHQRQEALDAIRLREEWLEWAQKDQPVAAKPKYGQYQLPGGENYREVVLALPERNAERDAVSRRFFQKPFAQLTSSERDFVVREVRTEPSGENYTSSHFTDVPNYVAHMRLNERADAEGKPGLFMGELQSDRGQSLRKEMNAATAYLETNWVEVVTKMKKDGILKVICP